MPPVSRSLITRASESPSRGCRISVWCSESLDGEKLCQFKTHSLWAAGVGGWESATKLVTVDVSKDLPDVVVRLASEGRATAHGNLLIHANTD